MGENKKRKLDILTLKDNFMFGAVMTDPENCRPFLEMALGIPIGKLTVSIEKSLVYHPEYKGVRLDVEASDENRTRFNVEMQVVPKPALAHRARYYHSQFTGEHTRFGGRLCATVAGCSAPGESEPGMGGEVYDIAGNVARTA